MKKVTAYEVIDHGFENASYFQGCGTTYTEFDAVYTGIGDTAREAFDDAVDNMSNEWDVSAIKGKSRLSRQTVRGMLRKEGYRGADVDDTEVRAYVSIRVR